MHCYFLEEISDAGGEGSVSLQVRWNRARFTIYLDPSPFNTPVPPIENAFISKYKAAADCQDDIDDDTFAGEILDAIDAAGRPLFDQLAPPSDDSVATDLHTHLFPDEFSFRLQTVQGNTELIRIDSLEPYPDEYSDHFSLQRWLQAHKEFNLPTFFTKDICLLDSFLHHGYIGHVLVEGEEMCSKAGEGKGLDAASRELDSLWRIAVSNPGASLRVPQLRGLVGRSDTEDIVGVLETYIPTSPDLPTLGHIENIGEIAQDRRKKWASQVQETVSLLHQSGVVWGDGKASNVLIHRDTDDAWVIDFGGGWTDGWLTPELSGTVEGDRVAVSKIFEFLGV